MPTVYEPLRSEGFEFCYPVDSQDFETLNVEICGAPKPPGWQVPRMRLVRRDAGVRLMRSDAPWLGPHALILRRDAAAAMGGMLTAHGELLDVPCTGADLVLYNVTNMIDALDEERSTLKRFDNGRIMWISNYKFHDDRLTGVDVFKIPSLRVSPTLVSQQFVDRWKELGLTGLAFDTRSGDLGGISNNVEM